MNLNGLSEEELQDVLENITEEEFEELDEADKETLLKLAESNEKLVKESNTKMLKEKFASKKLTNEALEQLDETPASDTVKTKSGAIADFVSRMQGMSMDDITNLAAQFKTVDKNDAAAPNNAAKNRATIAAKSVKEDLATVFGEEGKELSEDFLNQMTTLFESVLTARLAIEQEKMYEEASELVEELVEERVEEIEEAVDAYLNEAVLDWVNENQLAIESSIRLTQMESFFDGLKDLYIEHAIDIPDESLDMVEALTAENEQLKDRLNDAINENIEMKDILTEAQLEQIFDEVSEGLAVTQVEKLRSLTEGLEFADLDDYRSKVTLVKEANFKDGSVKKSSNLNEDVDVNADQEEAKKITDDTMARYASAISRDMKK